MKYRVIIKKIITILIIILFINLSTVISKEIEQNTKINLYGIEKVDNNISNNCYGFVIPLPSGNDSTYETFLNTKVRNLVNDLLREKIDIYWLQNFKYIDSKSIIMYFTIIIIII